MPIIDDIAASEAEFISLRHALHRNPGLGFQETFAAALVEDKLRAFGIDEVHTGIGGTGVVAFCMAAAGRTGRSASAPTWTRCRSRRRARPRTARRCPA